MRGGLWRETRAARAKVHFLDSDQPLTLLCVCPYSIYESLNINGMSAATKHTIFQKPVLQGFCMFCLFQQMFNKVSHCWSAVLRTGDSKQAVGISKSGYCSICCVSNNLVVSCQDRVVSIAATQFAPIGAESDLLGVRLYQCRPLPFGRSAEAIPPFVPFFLA